MKMREAHFSLSISVYKQAKLWQLLKIITSIQAENSIKCLREILCFSLVHCIEIFVENLDLYTADEILFIRDI
jgi:hypothetical protein